MTAQNNPFDKNVSEIISKLNESKEFEYLSLEVLLEGIAHHEEGEKALKMGGVVDLDSLKKDLATCNAGIRMATKSKSNGNDVYLTEQTAQIFERAVYTATAKNVLVKIVDIIAIIVSISSNTASDILKKHGFSLRALINNDSSVNKPSPKDKEDMEISDDEEFAETDILKMFTENLNEKAQAGKFDKFIGREKEIQRTIQTLTRRRKNNPLLVGEPGVGKTAVAEGLAKKIVDGDVPDKLKSSTIYSLNMGSLLAGTKFRGDFEKRMNNIMKRLAQDENAILFIDEIHTIVGASAVGGGQVDAANLLKPALSNGTIRVIGATTYKEKTGAFDSDAALSRRFQVVEVTEPTIDETIHILKGLRENYEKHHNVKYTDKALEEAVRLSVRYLTDRHLPDKAIDVMDEAGALQNIIPNAERSAVVKAKNIEMVIASMARVPSKNIKSDEKDRLRSLKEDLSLSVFGQDEAITALVNSVLVSSAGLGENGKTKPMGCFLFTGPTGVGKTEICKQLSTTLTIPLLRFDMSEYLEKNTIAKLIGAPAGYVGYEEGGLLTDSVSKNPYSIVLFDEIEKAHPDIFNIALQIMDNGFLTDSKGKKVDFRNTIIVFTTNTGAMAAQKNSIGFGNALNGNAENNRETEVNKMFTPEFRNRLDRIINFKSLSEDVVLKVIDKKLSGINDDLKAKKVEVIFNDELRHHLLKVGYDVAMGARPVVRKIQEIITVPMAEELLFGKLQYGGKVELGFKDDKVEIKVLQSKRKPRDKELEEEV